MRTTRVIPAVLVGTLAIAISASAEPKADFNALLTLTRYTDAHVGFAGETPEAVHAFRRILVADDAADLFSRLLEDATIEGQLYALCGLYFVDSARFRAAIPRYESLTQEVETQRGCIVGRDPVAELIHSPYKPVMDVGPDESPSEWLESHKHQAEDGFSTDISGGGFCHVLRGTMWNSEAEPSN